MWNFLNIINGLFNVNFEKSLSQQSGSDPEGTWSVGSPYGPTSSYKRTIESVKNCRIYDFLKFRPMLEIGNFPDFRNFS